MTKEERVAKADFEIRRLAGEAAAHLDSIRYLEARRPPVTAPTLVQINHSKAILRATEKGAKLLAEANTWRIHRIEILLGIEI